MAGGCSQGVALGGHSRSWHGGLHSLPAVEAAGILWSHSRVPTRTTACLRPRRRLAETCLHLWVHARGGQGGVPE